MTAALGERIWGWLLEPLAVLQPHPSCLDAALVPEITSHGQSLLSQSPHISDSFPSHVPGTEILSGGGGHVTCFLSSHQFFMRSC